MVVLGLVSLDFIFSPDGTEQGTFRLESEFDAVTAATATVGLIPSDYNDLSSPVSRSKDPSYEQVEDMVRKAIELSGGLGQVVFPGETVMVKVNLVGANSPSGQGENTDVRVVKALVKILDEHTNGDVKIQIAEGSARTNDDPNDPGSVWAHSGYTALLTDPYLEGIDFSLFNLNQGVDDMEEVDLGKMAQSSKQGHIYHVNKAELTADKYIVVPVLKIHDTGITNALKLQVGSAPGCWYGYNKMAGTKYSDPLYHDIAQRRWTSEMIVDLCNIAQIDFVVVDAIMTLEEYKTYSGYNQVRMNTIIAGVDPVAVDNVATRLFCLNPDDIAHITLAEKVGLGTNDPDKILVEGASIEDVRKKVVQNPTSYGQFGQSNRTWLLSQAFPGTDIKEEFIGSEASLRPEAGKDGWSEAVYFYDDRIDLLSYYGGRSNMVSYAFSYFYAPLDQEAELWLGTHEGIEVFLNGEMVYSYYSTNSAFNDAARGGHVKDISVKAGENLLLVKTLQKYGDYSFTLNICEHESESIQPGSRVAGLKFYTKSGAVGTKQKWDHSDPGTLDAFPNPASESVHFNLEFAAGSQLGMEIYSMEGKHIRTLKTDGSNGSGMTWNLEDGSGNRVNPGLYFCSVRSGNQVRTAKVMVR